MFDIRFAPAFARLTCNSIAWPDVDISESADNYLFKFDIPGALKDDIKVWIENDMLTVSGEKKKVANDKSEHLVEERAFGSFERSFKLPKAVDRNNVSAELVDGVLTIKLLKIIDTKKIPIA